MIPDPDHVQVQKMNTGDAAKLFQWHEQAKSEYLRSHDARPVELRTMNEILERQRQQAREQADYRRRIGGITEKELDLLNPGLSREDIKRLLKKIQESYAPAG